MAALVQPRKFRKTSGFPVMIDEEKAFRLIDHLYRTYQDRWGIYAHNNETTGPQHINMPGSSTTLSIETLNAYVQLQDELYEERIVLPETVERKSPQHIIWLFFATLTDRRQVSMEVYFAHRKLYAKHPELYQPDVRHMDPKKLGDILIKYRIGCPRQSADYWVKCAQTLYDQFSWDPLKLLEFCENSIEKMQEWKSKTKKADPKQIDPLPGYGPKIASLLTLYLAEMDLIAMPVDSFPVDMHVQRLFFQTGVAVGTEGFVFNEEMEDRLRRLICAYANEKGYSKISLSHAFWQLGRTLCTGCYKKNSALVLCPVYSQCAGPAETKAYFAKGTWPLPIRFMRKGATNTLCIPAGREIKTEEKIPARDSTGELVRNEQGKITFTTVSRSAFQEGMFPPES